MASCCIPGSLPGSTTRRYVQRKEHVGPVPARTARYRKAKKRKTLQEAVSQVAQVKVAELTSDDIVGAMLNIVSGNSSPDKAIRSLLTPDILDAFQQEGVDKFKERLRSAGHVQAALVKSGVSIASYESFMNTLPESMKGITASRQAQNYASTSIQEAMEIFLPMSATESPEGECHFFSVEDVYTVSTPRYFLEVCRKVINPSATKFIMPGRYVPKHISCILQSHLFSSFE